MSLILPPGLTVDTIEAIEPRAVFTHAIDTESMVQSWLTGCCPIDGARLDWWHPGDVRDVILTAQRALSEIQHDAMLLFLAQARPKPPRRHTMPAWRLTHAALDVDAE